MSTNGPICCTSNPFPIPTSSSSNLYFAEDGDTIRIVTPRTPASATATGLIGEICWDGGYIYVCINANTWVRAALSTW
jgi:hypothetical protein